MFINYAPGSTQKVLKSRVVWKLLRKMRQILYTQVLGAQGHHGLFQRWDFGLHADQFPKDMCVCVCVCVFFLIFQEQQWMKNRTVSKCSWIIQLQRLAQIIMEESFNYHSSSNIKKKKMMCEPLWIRWQRKTKMKVCTEVYPKKMSKYFIFQC